MPRNGDRAEAYAAAGRYIVDRSDVTIALWDGRRAGGKGGTAEVVYYIRKAKRPLVWLPTEGNRLITENFELSLHLS